jgi:hypothetical protein
MKRLVPSGATETWDQLRKNICNLIKIDYKNWIYTATGLRHEEEFLGDVIDKIDNYRKTCSYKYTPNSIQGVYVKCKYCWRSVQRTSLRKNYLCSEHDLKSVDPVIKVRRRIIGHVNDKYNELENRIEKILVQVDSKKDLEKWKKFALLLCRNNDCLLPNLVKYLNTLNNTLNMPLETGEDIIKALEFPVSHSWDTLDENLKKGWKYLFEYRGYFFEKNFRQLLHAEAWLWAEKNYTREGARRSSEVSSGAKAG